MLTTLFKFLLMFLFERLKTPNNKTPDIKKKKQKSYRWEVVCICHSAVAPVCTQASCRQRCGRDRRTHRPNVIHEQQTRESERKAIKSWRLPVQVLLPKRNTGKTPNVFSLIPTAKDLGSVTTLCRQALVWVRYILASPASWATTECSAQWMMF